MKYKSKMTTIHTVGVQCLRKVFRPLDSFHILLHYSLILQLILFLINLHTIPHNDKAKEVCRKFSKCIKNTKLKYHIYISIQTLYFSTSLKNLWQRLQP